ncbi:MAG: hypothetical protein HYY17_06415 [Planctomycetes bacterium]|nr:hypothetical protein [Planctomycetota bacterium]
MPGRPRRRLDAAEKRHRREMARLDKRHRRKMAKWRKESEKVGRVTDRLIREFERLVRSRWWRGHTS